MQNFAKIYTDGSYHPPSGIGIWAAIIIIDETEQVLHEQHFNTSQHRMELLAVIESVNFMINRYPDLSEIQVFTDSHYVTGLMSRKEKLVSRDFSTQKGNQVANADLIKEFFQVMEARSITLYQEPSHSRKDSGHNLNRKVDKLARQILRKKIDSLK